VEGLSRPVNQSVPEQVRETLKSHFRAYFVRSDARTASVMVNTLILSFILARDPKEKEKGEDLLVMKAE